MSNEPIDIDNLFKNALENAPMTPPPGAFFAIQSQFPSLAATAAIGTKAVVSIKMLALIAASFIVAGTAVYYFVNKTVEPSGISSENKTLEVTAIEKTATSAMPIPSGEAQQNASVSEPLNSVAGNITSRGLPGIETRNNFPSVPSNEITKGQPNQAVNSESYKRSEISTWPRAVSAISGGMETFPQVSTQSNGNLTAEGVRKASQEKKNGAILNAGVLNCKARFEVNLSEPVQGAHELAFKVQGEFGRYDWGLGSQVLGTWTAREGRVNRPIYVKKSQELHFWIRAHFLDGCKDSQAFVRWVSPKNNEIQDVFPSIFTPNNDGYNDSFYVTMSEPEFYEITVMDTRGNRVFTSKNPHEKWSGMVGDRPCPNGIYQVQLTRRYSHEKDSEKRNFKLELR